MSKNILNDLPELLRANVIDEETAKRITAYYDAKPNASSNRLFVVFGILGALLISMGLVLIVAHNWDDLPKAAKLFIGLLPMLIGQGVCGYLVVKDIPSRAWREGCGAYLCFTIALSIAVVGQVYNLEGNFPRFLMVWMLLTLPAVYVLRSSMAAMLYVCGVTWYACELGYFHYPSMPPWKYWPMLALVLPFCYTEFIMKGFKNNFYYFISWLVVLSVTFCIGAFENHHEDLVIGMYMSLFSVFVLLSELKAFETHRVLTNPLLLVGSLGIMCLLLLLSFDWYWDELDRFTEQDNLASMEFYFTAILSALAVILMVFVFRAKSIASINLKGFAFLIFIALYIMGINAPGSAQLLVNLVILIFAVYTIRSGAKQNHLGILNYGLLIITALILCRFFDTDFSFILRGLLFIAVGIGFFAANYYMIKKRKQNA
ncbi:DUF2157 domain-containing protein [Chryseolinea lacunae]|uniref:DUF2157 domain-containing protein n=1 Tax=Chryseolinea lacunae TaxID=2801331 RepID=A0ABS1KUT8_9BACT|nr:DUF2157 domain-containing protein [Chryseolinea lacunae]MBL0743234.1 DUF2157 domain-containing protein [Chryseolinea lacunae]